jgi:hypothetical protein
VNHLAVGYLDPPHRALAAFFAMARRLESQQDRDQGAVFVAHAQDDVG